MTPPFKKNCRALHPICVRFADCDETVPHSRIATARMHRGERGRRHSKYNIQNMPRSADFGEISARKSYKSGPSPAKVIIQFSIEFKSTYQHAVNHRCRRPLVQRKLLRRPELLAIRIRRSTNSREFSFLAAICHQQAIGIVQLTK